MPIEQLLRRTCKQDEIAVGIAYDESPSTPRFNPEWLCEHDAGVLVFEEKRLGVVESNRCGKQLIPLAKFRVEAALVDVAEVQPRPVAEYLSVERWFAVAEGQSESEFFRVELAGRREIRDEELRLGSQERRLGVLPMDLVDTENP